MKKTLSVEIELWMLTENGNKEVPQGYRTALLEEIEPHVFGAIKEGYVQGQLNETLMLNLEGEPEDGLEFQGSWTCRQIVTDDE